MEKAKVADTLYLKQDILANKADNYLRISGRLVVEVHEVTCSGGTQIFYAFRGYNKEGGSTLILLNEVEVTDEFVSASVVE